MMTTKYDERSAMKETRNATFEEVRSCFEDENRRSDIQKASESFGWCIDQLNSLEGRSGQWKLVDVSEDDMLGIRVETGHNHSIPGSEPLIRSGQTVSEAVNRLRILDPATMPKCWENINHQKHREMSQTHLILKRESGQLWHIDGIHRMLAWLHYGKDGTLPAFVWEIL
jgi:hypothetical protein